MLSNACNAGSRLLHGEEDLINQGLLIGGSSWQGGGEKLSMEIGGSHRVLAFPSCLLHSSVLP